MKIENSGQYVSRGALKLAGAADKFSLDFKDKQVLDVGSSTGGFSDYAIQHGAKRVIAVDSGTNQLHPKLRLDSRIELHEKTDIRGFKSQDKPDFILIDASFISLRKLLPAVAKLSSDQSQIIALFKPQFEARPHELNRGVIKNDSIRRALMKDFENWVKQYFIVQNKADSSVAGASGNQERFYLLKKI